MHTALEEVREVLDGEGFPLCESASLRLEKFVRLGKDEQGKETKRQEIEAVVSKNQRCVPLPLPKGAVRFVAKLGGRLIVNQAGGVLENAGLCLHRHFNAPYIPGSALKGIARHAAWEAWYNANPGEAKDAAAREVAEVFGFPTGDARPKDDNSGRDFLDEYLVGLGYEKKKAKAGKVAFLPAVPSGKAHLEVDMVNCHHPGYYRGEESFQQALDIEKPLPNYFPVVATGTQFVFTLVPLRGGDAILERAEFWLKTALQEHGIGAKTAAGYGWFVYDEKENCAWVKLCKKKDDEAKLSKRYRDAADKIVELYDRACSEPAETVGELLKSKVPVLEKEVADLREKDFSVSHEIVSRLEKLVDMMPQEKPLDRLRRQWKERGLENVVQDRMFRNFQPERNPLHRLVVELLRENDGIGHDVWTELKRLSNDGNRGRRFRHVQRLVQVIQEFSRSISD